MTTSCVRPVFFFFALAALTLGCGGSPKPPPAEEPIGLTPSTTDTTTAANTADPTPTTADSAEAPTTPQPTDSTDQASGTPDPFVLKGKPAPEVSGKLEGKGRAPTIKGSKGKVVVVFFFLSGSLGGGDLVKLQDLAKKNKGKLGVIGVSVDDDEKALKAFIAKNKITVPVLFDGKKATQNAYQPSASEGVYVVDKTGTITDVNFGFLDPDAIQKRL